MYQKKGVAFYAVKILSPTYFHYACGLMLGRHLKSIRHYHPDSALWISGDINLPNVDWASNFISSYFMFLDFLQANAL